MPRPPALALGVLLLLALGACGGEPADGGDAVSWDAVAGGTWRLHGLEGEDALPGVEVTLAFPAPDRAGGSGGVNRWFATVTRAGPRGVGFGETGSTRMAGPPEAMAQEARFLALLARVDAWRVTDGRLELLGAGSPLLAFDAVAD